MKITLLLIKRLRWRHQRHNPSICCHHTDNFSNHCYQYHLSPQMPRRKTSGHLQFQILFLRWTFKLPFGKRLILNLFTVLAYLNDNFIVHKLCFCTGTNSIRDDLWSQILLKKGHVFFSELTLKSPNSQCQCLLGLATTINDGLTLKYISIALFVSKLLQK